MGIRAYAGSIRDYAWSARYLQPNSMDLVRKATKNGPKKRATKKVRNHPGKKRRTDSPKEAAPIDAKFLIHDRWLLLLRHNTAGLRV